MQSSRIELNATWLKKVRRHVLPDANALLRINLACRYLNPPTYLECFRECR
jgi:hypothetical protein